MSAKARKLGRGLDSLIRRSGTSEPGKAEIDVQRVNPRHIAVNRAQPRLQFNEDRLEELARSIEKHGILQPLVVHLLDSGSYELIAGERRLRAALRLELDAVPVVVRAFDQENLLDLALIENIQREDLNPIELAQAYRTLKERHQWTQAALAEHLGKKRSSIANTIRYLDLPPRVQESLAEGEIHEGHAKVLLAVPDDDDRLILHREVVDEALTVRDLEERVSHYSDRVTGDPAKPKKKKGPRVDPQVEEQAQLLSTRLGTKVHIKGGTGGRGRIVIEYYSHEDFERIRDSLG